MGLRCWSLWWGWWWWQTLHTLVLRFVQSQGELWAQLPQVRADTPLLLHSTVS